eukprot:8881985-Alexandrium_andersonii.AAC.1
MTYVGKEVRTACERDLSCFVWRAACERKVVSDVLAGTVFASGKRVRSRERVKKRPPQALAKSLPA